METAVAVDFQHCIQMLEKREETEISKNSPALEHHSQYPSQIKSFHFIFKSKSIHIITPLIESISNCVSNNIMDSVQFRVRHAQQKTEL